MKAGRTLPLISPHKQTGHQRGRHAPAPVTISELDLRYLSFVIACFFSADPLYGPAATQAIRSLLSKL
jgi:hypothetical protein